LKVPSIGCSTRNAGAVLHRFRDTSRKTNSEACKFCLSKRFLSARGFGTREAFPGTCSAARLCSRSAMLDAVTKSPAIDACACAAVGTSPRLVSIIRSYPKFLWQHISQRKEHGNFIRLCAARRYQYAKASANCIARFPQPSLF
jgi:hypothetical protein